MENTESYWQRLLDNCLEQAAATTVWQKNNSQTPRPRFAPIAPVPSKPSENLPAILFSGHLQESIPHKLMQDSRLTPLERNAWIAFRMSMDRRGVASASLRYEDLRPCISMVPGGKASMRTVSKVIANLRTTRWLTLLERGRDKASGQLKSSVYILHDEPLTLEETLQLDANYVEHIIKFAEKDKNNPNTDKSTLLLAEQALMELEQAPEKLPTRLQRLVERISEQLRSKPYRMSAEAAPSDDKKPSTAPTTAPVAGKVEGKNGQKKPTTAPTTAPVAGFKPSESGLLPLRKKGTEALSTVCKNIQTEPVCTPDENAREKPKIQEILDEAQRKIPWPEALSGIKPEDKRSLEIDLATLAPDLAEQVLASAAQSCQQRTINNPAGYLRALINRAQNGKFKVTTAPKKQADASLSNRPVYPIFQYSIKPMTARYAAAKNQRFISRKSAKCSVQGTDCSSKCGWD